MTKILTAIFTSLILLNGCAGIPDTGMSPTYDFSKIRTIGIFIEPSGEKIYDGQFYNLLSLNFISLGYTVVDLNPNVAAGTPEKSPSFAGINRTVRTMHDDPNNTCDAIVVASPTWKKAIKVTSESKYHISGFQIQLLDLELVMVDIKTMTPVISRNFNIEQRLFTDERNNQVLMVPVRFTIQECLTEIFKKFPVCSTDQSRPGLYKLPVIVYVDKSYRQYYGSQWNLLIARRLLYANDILRNKFSVELVVKEYREWTPWNNVNTNVGLFDLSSTSNDIQDHLVIGILRNNSLQFNWRERNDIGVAEYLGNHLVVCDLPSFPGREDWDALEEAVTIVHEVGHILGAIHTMDYGSIMFPQSGFMSFRFDSLNAAMIEHSCRNFLTEKVDVRFQHGLSLLNESYLNSKTIKTFFVQTMYSLIAQQRKMKKYNGNMKDSVKTDFSLYTNDEALQNALSGYAHFTGKRWKESEKYFLRAVELNPKFGEIYYYLVTVYEEMVDKEKMSFYKKLALQHTYEFQD